MAARASFFSLHQLQRLRARLVTALQCTKTPEEIQKRIDQIDEHLAQRTSVHNPAKALPKKVQRALGLLPPVGSYLCGVCGDIAPDHIGWVNMTPDGVGVCLECNRKAQLNGIESEARKTDENTTAEAERGEKQQEHTHITPPKGEQTGEPVKPIHSVA